MKQLFFSAPIIIALMFFFIFVDGKEFNRNDNVQSVQSEGEDTDRRNPLVSVLETKIVAAEKESIEAIYITEAIPLKEITVEIGSGVESKPVTEKNLLVEAKLAEINSVSNTNKPSPVAVPVLTPEEAKKANEDALRIQLAKEQSVANVSKSIRKTNVGLKLDPAAVPVLTPEEAINANKEAIRVQKDQERAKKFKHIISIIKNILKQYCVLFFIIATIVVADFLFKKDSVTKQKESLFSLKRVFETLVSTTLLLFGLIIFVPYSVYFGNISDFPFIFSDFLMQSLAIMLCAIVVLGLLLLIIPPHVSKYLLAFIIGLGVCVYFQPMFMNYYVDRMNGVEPKWGQHSIWGCFNLIIWISITLFPIVIQKKYLSHWPTIIALAVIILGIEFITTVSMIFSAPSAVWQRKNDAVCDGSYQFQYSKEKNIIVLIMDALDRDFIKACLENNPHQKEVLKDFTWYVEAKSSFAYTYLALHQEMTGSEIHPSNGLKEMYDKSWHSPSAKSFYKQMKDSGYDNRLYVNAGQNIGPYSLFQEYFSNILELETEHIINYKRLQHCLVMISGFSSMPFYLKKYFFYGDDFANDVVEQRLLKKIELSKNAVVENSNDKFYKKMISSGISTDATSPIFSFNYIRGAHKPWNTDEKCEYHEPAFDTFMPTTQGLIFLISELIRLLKENGIYDQTAILICSDHGNNIVSYYNMAFMVKPFFANNDEIIMDKSRIYVLDILPLLLDIACKEKADYTDFVGFPPSNIPVDRKRKVYNPISSSACPVFMGINDTPYFHNALEEYDADTNKLIQIIPLKK